MSVLQSIFLGIVQGITEFLPVSSSGHLAILENVFHIDTDGGMLFDIMLHVGTLAAVFVVYHKDIWRMIVETFKMIGDLFANLHIYMLNRIHKTSLKYRRVVHNNYRKFVMLVLVSTIPTGLIGIIGKGLVSAAGQTLLIPGICLLMTGVLLLIADTTREGHKLPRQVTYKNGLFDRSGTGAGDTCRDFPVPVPRSPCACCLEWIGDLPSNILSFLSIPAVLGAALLEVKDVIAEPVKASQIGVYAIGMVFAAVVGYICIKTMLIVVKNKKFKYFSYYCFIVGAVAIAGHFLL